MSCNVSIFIVFTDKICLLKSCKLTTDSSTTAVCQYKTNIIKMCASVVRLKHVLGADLLQIEDL